jgi:hypothetical protein
MAQTAATRQWVPLQVVNPSLIPGRLVCGPVGSTQEQFAAINNGAFRVTVDGAAFNVGPVDFTGMASMLDTAGFLTCGAMAATQAQWAAVNNGEFGLALNGAAPVNVGPCDFTVIPSTLDTRATLTCGVNGSLLAAWQAVTAGAVGDFRVTVDGVIYNLVGLDYALIVNLNDVAITTTAAALGAFEVQYNVGTNTYVFLSGTVGVPSTITFLGPVAAPVNDISGTVANTFFNGEAAPAVLVQGTGSDGYHQTVTDVLNDNLIAAFGPGSAPVDSFVGGAIVFTSPDRGEDSAVGALVAGGGGTDISGAGFLNGVAGVATAGTGHDGFYSDIA